MSVVLITTHDESIYSITSETHKSAEKPSPPHRINARKHQIPSVTTQRKELYATMGPAEYPPPDTRDYLKKKTWKPPMRKPSRVERDRTIRAAPIPHTADAIREYEEKVKAATKKRNFIVENIKYALTLKPKEPQKRLVLDCHGDSKDINRGLEPQFLHSAVFGKTPKYLKRMVEGRERIVQLEKDITVAEKPKCRYITKEEREELLTGLKNNWEELQKRYQGLPILTDSAAKIQRKVKLENELKQLENDIMLLEKHPYIYVYDDNELK